MGCDQMHNEILIKNIPDFVSLLNIILEWLDFKKVVFVFVCTSEINKIGKLTMF